MIGVTYKTWLRKWRKAGSPKWPTLLKIMMVHWTDAAYSEEDTGTIDAIKVGILIDADDDMIALAMEGFEDRETRTKITVPAGMVNRVVDVAAVKAFPA